MAHGRTPSSSYSWLPIWLALMLVAVAIWISGRGRSSVVVQAPEITSTAPNLPAASGPAAVESNDDAATTQSVASSGQFLTTIRRPAGPPVIKLDQVDPHGRTGTIACSTCHSVREPNHANRAQDLDQFHQNMPMAHGTLTCYSCHNPDDTDTLRLADSTTVAYPDVMTMCAQCHGPQMRDFERGAHGGMNGYWDLSRGPRTRNNCIDCHDPHLPKFPAMKPTFKPRDRFLKASNVHEKDTADGHPVPSEVDHE